MLLLWIPDIKSSSKLVSVYTDCNIFCTNYVFIQKSIFETIYLYRCSEFLPMSAIDEKKKNMVYNGISILEIYFDLYRGSWLLTVSPVDEKKKKLYIDIPVL